MNSGGTGGIGGSAGDTVADASGSGGVMDTPQGGSGGNPDLAGTEQGGAGGKLDAPTVDIDGGTGEAAGGLDSVTGEEAAESDGSGTRDASPEATADVVIDAATDAANAPTTTGLVVYYPCEQANGTSLTDVSGNGNDGTIHTATGSGVSPGSGYAFSGGKVGNALTLSQAGSAYVSLPSSIFTATVDVTIATWVRLNSLTARQRLFDVGSNANLSQNTATGTAYATLFLKDLNNKLDLSCTKNGYANEQHITSDALPTGVWKHVAVVFGGGTGTLYIDGAVVSANSSILPPQSLGINYVFIGKSQFASEPFIDAQIDEFRVYNRALSVSEIQSLFLYAGP